MENTCKNCGHIAVRSDKQPCEGCCAAASAQMYSRWIPEGGPGGPTDVLITLQGGCVEVEHKPPGVIVRIKDYDHDGTGDVQEDENGTYELYEW